MKFMLNLPQGTIEEQQEEDDVSAQDRDSIKSTPKEKGDKNEKIVILAVPPNIA